MPQKRLFEKLARIAADPAASRDFMICDAKDSDMGFGLAHTGPQRDPSGRSTDRFRPRAEFLEQIKSIVHQDIVDLMLMSVWTLDQLAFQEKLFEGSAVATAIRANDATDVWALRHAAYQATPSLPFRTAAVEHAMHGRLVPSAGPSAGADLGLYSITFNNDAEADARTLEAFRAFRLETEAKGFNYFLEVFNPNAATGLADEHVGAFVNDCIIRCLAGIAGSARPAFLKVVYNGPRALEELASYDPGLVVGVLGGSSGTTHDCFKLIHDIRRHGARLALFGRKINLSEHPTALIALMWRVVDGEIAPAEAVKAYHAELDRAGIRPQRALDDDLALTEAHLADG